MPRKKAVKKKKTAKRKAVKKPKAVKEEIFYVGIQDSLEIKHGLLESSKDLLQYLDRFEKLKGIREKKKSEMEHLREIFTDITKSTNKLKRFLPKTKLRIDIHKKPARKKAKKEEVPKKAILPKKDVVKKMPKPPITEEEHDEDLAKLEAELSAIEGRLSKLD